MQKCSEPRLSHRTTFLLSTLLGLTFRWLLATVYWFTLTAGFFGPSLFDRILVASGGECRHEEHGKTDHLTYYSCIVRVIL
jgi:hypothetical protein